MSRICLMISLAVGVGLAGCAVCDTCDDFPVPCVGPNCGQLSPGGIPGYFDAGMGPQAAPGPQAAQGPQASEASDPTEADSTGPVPAMPAPGDMPATPTVNPVSPPAPMEPNGGAS